MKALLREDKYMEQNEEFNNFMHRVNEVNSIVKQLSSEDPTDQNIGQMRADMVLGTDEKDLVCDDDGEVLLKVNTNRSVINKKAFKEMPAKDPDTMDVEVFQREIEKDVAKRTADRKIRTEKAETFKVQGNKAFRRGEYERALSCYNKAIEHVKDSCLLYNNRTLTLLKLRLYDRAKRDCEWALKLNEHNLKAMLYNAHACYALGDVAGCEQSLRQAETAHPKQKTFIDEFKMAFEKEITAAAPVYD